MSDQPLTTLGAAGLRPAIASFRRHAFLRFVLVGALNTIFGYCVFLVAWLLTRNSLVALAIATIVGVAFNFLSTGALVFGSAHRRHVAGFVAIYGVLFLLNGAALRVFETAGLTAIWAQALLTAPMAALSYLLNSRFVFRGANRRRSAI